MTGKLTLRQIAEIYQVTPKTFARRVRSEKIPHEKIGRHMRFNLAQVEIFLARSEKPSRTFRKGQSVLKSATNKFAEAVGL